MNTTHRKSKLSRRVLIGNPLPGTNSVTSRKRAEELVGKGHAKWVGPAAIKLNHAASAVVSGSAEAARASDQRWGYDLHVYGKLATRKQLSRHLPILGDATKMLMRTNKTGPGLVAA